MLTRTYENNPDTDGPISKLKCRKSAGHDGIPADFLKHGDKPALKVLTKLMQAVWRSERIPKQWRKGTITSLHKAGDRTDPNNYRPITLLPTIDKLFTAILANRLERAVPLHDHQSAFRSNRGVYDPLTTITSILEDRKHAKLRTHAFFPDLQKAYDQVWHAGLFYKLHHKGIQGKMWRVLHALYSDCCSAPKLDGNLGPYFHVKRGVAQGCPMSPILFNIMIDDLIETLQTTCQTEGISISPGHTNIVAMAYADDIHALSGTKAGLQKVIDTFTQHVQLWQAPINTQKSHTMTFNPTGRPTTPAGPCSDDPGPDCWTCNGRNIPHRTQTKLLGIHLTQNFTWKEHADYAIQKGKNAFYMWVNTLKNKHMPMKAKRAIIQQCIKPCITYGMELWAPPSQNYYDKLDRPIKWAIRTALHIKHRERQAFPIVLLHNDLAIRPMTSENKAAHIVEIKLITMVSCRLIKPLASWSLSHTLEGV